MFITIPVLYYPDGYDPEQEENLGLKNKKKVELIKGEMDVNTKQICSFNEMDSGNTLIRLSNGDLVETTILYSSFKGLIEKTECYMELVYSNEN
jgi:hypothetical protein